MIKGNIAWVTRPESRRLEGPPAGCLDLEGPQTSILIRNCRPHHENFASRFHSAECSFCSANSKNGAASPFKMLQVGESKK